jgi:hypothetical protein
VNLIIRRADVQDIPSIAQLFLEFAAEIVDREPTFRHMPEQTGVDRRYESRVRDPERAVMVAVIDESVAGFVYAVLVRSTDTASTPEPASSPWTPT